MNILVTGGSGFIGSELVRQLAEQRHTITNLDVRPPSSRISELASWVQGSVLERSQLIEIIDSFRPSVIFHLATTTDINASADVVSSSIVDGTLSLLRAASAAKFRGKLIHTSTQMVVGPGHFPLSDTYYHPYTPYGEAKMRAEELVRNLSSDFRWTIVRPTNIWGPEHPTYPRGVWRYLRRGHYAHPAGVRVTRAYGYLENTAAQFVAIINANPSATDGRTIYLGDEELDTAEWLDTFSVALRGKLTRRVPAAGLRIAARIGDVFASIGAHPPLTSGRLERMTTSHEVPLAPIWSIAGKPAISLDDGVEKTAAWLRTTFPNWY